MQHLSIMRVQRNVDFVQIKLKLPRMVYYLLPNYCTLIRHYIRWDVPQVQIIDLLKEPRDCVQETRLLPVSGGMDKKHPLG